jgi:hypothetical protein
MICLKRFSFALAFCFAASISLWGQTAPVVYVATGNSNVYSVTPSGVATQLIPASNTSYSGAQFTSLTVGPDNTTDNTNGNTYFFLYACDTGNNNIVRLRLSTNSPGTVSGAVATIYDGGGSLTAPVCGRVASNGDLYVSSANSGSGVYVLPDASTATGGFPLSATQVYNIGGSFTGGGIAQKNNGDMLVVNKAAGSILRARFVGAIPPNSPYSPFASALDSSAFVTGLSSPSAITRISTGKFFVANQGAETVQRFDPANLSSPTTCSVTIPSGNVTLSSVAASEDNFVYVGIASTSQNKRVVQILNGRAANCGSVTSISLSALNATTVAAVAVPPVSESPVSTSSNTDSSGVTASNFNFGSSAVQTLTQGCTPTVTQGQAPISYLQGMVNVATPDTNYTGTWSGGVPVAYNGEAGFGTVYTVSSSCDPANVYNNFIIGSLIDNTQFTNPRIIRCDGSTDKSNLVCTVSEAAGTWPVGGLVQDDLTVGGKVPGFSRFFVANANASGGTDLATFCDFGSPLTTTLDPAQASIFNSGQNLSVKFKLGAAGTVNSCSNGPYITNAQALLSVARVADGAGHPVFEPIAINSSGNSTVNPPTFSYNPNNQQYQFSLSLKGYAPGTYSLTVTFLTNNTGYQTTIFKVQ